MSAVAGYEAKLVDPKQVAKGWRRCLGCTQAHVWNLHTEHPKLYVRRPGPLSIQNCPSASASESTSS